MGTETNSSRVVCPTLYVILVKLNNPLMGTETLLRCNNACISASNVKLNNPLMGTETEVLPLKGLL